MFITGNFIAYAINGLNELRTTGIGISEEDLPFVFDHFYRSDKSRDKKSGGSGIGLAIVRQLIEIHGGLVEAVSRPGKGSSFRLFLPLNDNL
jgi:two-component system sensor histidine kinase BaeS